jgi:hypothetical protein
VLHAQLDNSHLISVLLLLLPLQVRSICEEMSMDGCERCMPSWQAGRTWADCDLLDTYGLLCYAMPGGWGSVVRIAVSGGFMRL